MLTIKFNTLAQRICYEEVKLIYMADHTQFTLSHFSVFLRRIVSNEKKLYQATIVYSIAISLLILIVPVAIQTVINTVANSAQDLSLLILVAGVLLLLVIAALFYALQIYVMELFQRRFFARTVAEIVTSISNIAGDVENSIKSNGLVERYFEIMFVQQSVPNLIVGGVSLLLRMIVGLLVVSFYHPFLFMFSIIFATSCLIIWRLCHRDMYNGAYSVSLEKYNMANALERLVDKEFPFETDARKDISLVNIDRLNNDYISARKEYFRTYLRQNLGFLLVYVLANGGLLALGGWLVLQEQLSLGQLVAAELILSTIFASLPWLGYYLKLYYELCVSARKLDDLIRHPAKLLNDKEEKNDGDFSSFHFL
ncbi:hypothetical protein [Azomonas macrocytogenes]|uniref:ABC-type bacteriocin/lantibiotic exporter with double-glycine peptidase domain n=1 Tax=Azomonas macrocytogenes TaxID=69962 RepID=A0A839T656_AZOMA|nr:hypothetical protein [Azomonas macrocytogenes]MBB3104902.1 ABC-type bacteriocin/lantibiotic exporter with double-glycine peptidase domain [Azomonas macrocytogenes]